MYIRALKDSIESDRAENNVKNRNFLHKTEVDPEKEDRGKIFYNFVRFLPFSIRFSIKTFII